MDWLKSLLPQLRWGAGPKGIPFHVYFLRRVLRVRAVQRWRDSVTEPWEEVGPFFDEGRIDTTSRGFWWSISYERPELFRSPGGIVIAGDCQPPMSESLRRTWDATVEGWQRLLLDGFQQGTRTAIGTHAGTGSRRELAAAEWPLGSPRMMVDIKSGDILERSGRAGVPPTVHWRGLAILPPELPPPPAKRGTIDRDDLWLCLILLYERGELPPPGPPSTTWSSKFIKGRYGDVSFDESELREYLRNAREGATERPKRTHRRGDE